MRRLPTFRLTIALVAWSWIALEAPRMALFREIGLDEFTYAHGGWLNSQGEIPYRDFFFHHFPGALGLLSSVFRFGMTGSEALLALRLLMVLCFLGMLAMCSRLSSRDFFFSLFTPLFLLVNEPFMGSMLSIRPDSFALMFFLGSLLSYRRSPGACCGRDSQVASCTTPLLSGILFSLAVFCSEKVLVYGAPMMACAGWRALNRAGRAGRHFFLASGVASLALWFPLLTSTGWKTFADHCIAWNLIHEEYYPAIAWWPHLSQIFLRNPWLPFFGILGISNAIVASSRRRGEGILRREPHDDAPLLLATLVSSFLAFTMQRGAYFYSYAPFLAFLAIFAGRGLELVARIFGRAEIPVSSDFRIPEVAVAFAFLGIFVFSARSVHLPIARTNFEQLRDQQLLESAISPGDAVYDNSGAAVSQPSVHRYYFTDSVVRLLKAELLNEEIPKAIEAAGASAMFVDYRFPELPGKLQRYLREHFQPLTPSLWLWGAQLDATAESTFLAVREGRYFIFPREAASAISVDGKAPDGPIFPLSRGPHQIRFAAPPPFPQVYLLWLPQNEALWAPYRKG